MKNNLKLLLLQRGMSAKALANAVGTDKYTMSRIQNGLVMPTVEMAQAIANVLKCSLTDIWSEEQLTYLMPPISHETILNDKDFTNTQQYVKNANYNKFNSNNNNKSSPPTSHETSFRDAEQSAILLSGKNTGCNLLQLGIKNNSKTKKELDKEKFSKFTVRVKNRFYNLSKIGLRVKELGFKSDQDWFNNKVLPDLFSESDQKQAQTNIINLDDVILTKGEMKHGRD